MEIRHKRSGTGHSTGSFSLNNSKPWHIS